MSSKLTLSIEEELIKKAKAFAKGEGRSLSDLISSYLKSLTQKKDSQKESSYEIESMLGAFKEPESFDYKENLTKSLNKKYL